MKNNYDQRQPTSTRLQESGLGHEHKKRGFVKIILGRPN